MLIVLSSFAQEESKNVSDDLKWGVKRLMMNTFKKILTCSKLKGL